MRWGRETKGVGTEVFGALFWCECELPPVINFTSILCQFPFTKNYKAKLQPNCMNIKALKNPSIQKSYFYNVAKQDILILLNQAGK